MIQTVPTVQNEVLHALPASIAQILAIRLHHFHFLLTSVKRPLLQQPNIPAIKLHIVTLRTHLLSSLVTNQMFSCAAGICEQTALMFFGTVT